MYIHTYIHIHMWTSDIRHPRRSRGSASGDVLVSASTDATVMVWQNQVRVRELNAIIYYVCHICISHIILHYSIVQYGRTRSENRAAPSPSYRGVPSIDSKRFPFYGKGVSLSGGTTCLRLLVQHVFSSTLANTAGTC